MEPVFIAFSVIVAIQWTFFFSAKILKKTMLKKYYDKNTGLTLGETKFYGQLIVTTLVYILFIIIYLVAVKK